jgi:capsule polysaccharide export protein KpsC/LpsZ
VFVALQMTGDSVQELAGCTPIEMIEDVIAACEKLNYAVVVKRHPLCGSAVIGKYLLENEAAGRIQLSAGSIHEIIARAEAVCVVNSGVGAEALLHEKPVYVFGRSDYMAACFVCAAPGDFERQFQPGRAALSSDELRRFWYLFRNDYAVDLRNRNEAEIAIRARVESHLAAVSEYQGRDTTLSRTNGTANHVSRS